ncbi:uncharacterized protein [Clytia hemisphaerica]
MATIPCMTQKLMLLQPKPIDPTKCNQNESLYWQIIRNNQTVSNRQAKQFNLGNTIKFNDPIKAAMFLLQREYGDSSLFVEDLHEAVFIPPTFVSNQYTKKSSVAILDYGVKKDVDRLLSNLKGNSPDNWLTMELEELMQAQSDSDQIDKNIFDKWVMNLKVMYLTIEELKTDQVDLPSTTSELATFVQACINEIPQTSPEPEFKTFLRESLSKKNFKKFLQQKVQEKPPQDSNLQWLFGLELSELGEQLEHWFYDQLLPLENDILQDTVVLSSVNFLTNVRNKMHKEADFLIISWKRKLVISVEMKSELKNDRVFKQLDSNHQLFEERLGDQLEPGWTFFPVICAGKSPILMNSRHFITMETDIKTWLMSIFNKFPILPAQKPTPLDQVQKLLKIIVFSIHVSKKDLVAPITSSNWVDYVHNAIENVSTSDNILFYSNQQMAVLNSNDPRFNKLIILGPFGTGKTVLLQHKAIQLTNHPQYKGKVMYLMQKVEEFYAPSKISSMLYHRMKIDLEERHGIFVMDVRDSTSPELHKKDLKQIIQKIAQHDIKAIFCDEFEINDNIELLKKMVETVDFSWIVPSTANLRDSNFEQWEGDFIFLNLSQNFRNSREIVKTTLTYAEQEEYRYKKGLVMPLENFPCGRPPVIMRTFYKAMKEARERTKGGILVIGGKSKLYERLNRMHENWKNYNVFQNDLKENENPYTFLHEGNVLIVDSWVTYGFEWSTVIIMENDLILSNISRHACNQMMRCTTHIFKDVNGW